ncbi:MAG: hypothetical protein JWO90_1540 [Solirubrobacterales bacterium]|nr:hypothetical protein [Solirubrobacterales bacterium]
MCDHLGSHDGRALAPEGCALELLTDRPGNPRQLQAIVSWDRAVPLKVERLAVAVMGAGGVLRRDLDADGLRHRAVAAGHLVRRILTTADVEAFVRTGPLLAPNAPRIGLAPALTSAA